MKVAVTTHARLYKNTKGEYFAKAVYGYDFFTRYLSVFENVKIIAHVENISDDKTEKMLRVDGPNVEVYDVFFPHGKIQYIKNYSKIKKQLKMSVNDCDAVLIRIPDQLAFQLYNVVKGKLPLAVEVTADPWMLFKKGYTKKSLLRPFIRLGWYLKQKQICKKANGTAYVTKEYLQSVYPYSVGEAHFTASYTNTDIDDSWFSVVPNKLKDGIIIVHVATAISGYAKGHKELLIAVGELVKMGYNVKVVLIGGGELNQENLQIVDRYGIKDRIVKTGTLTKQQIMDEFSKADLFVFPSYTEGLPRVVIEAMASGLACVATELPGIKELLLSEWLVPVKDTILLTKKIEQLFDNNLREQVAIKNRENAKFYAIEPTMQKRKEYYSKLYKLAKNNKK